MSVNAIPSVFHAVPEYSKVLIQKVNLVTCPRSYASGGQTVSYRGGDLAKAIPRLPFLLISAFGAVGIMLFVQI